MSKHTNNLEITANAYADNLYRAIAYFDKHKTDKSHYEQDLGVFYNKAVEIFKVNRLRCQEFDISKFEKSIRAKENKKIRFMIQTTESEIKRVEKDRFNQNLLDACTKFRVKLETVKKIIK